MSNKDLIISKLTELAAKVEVIEPGPTAKFKKLAYLKAIKAIAALPKLDSAEELISIKGIGDGIRKKVAEILSTGSIALMDEAVNDYSDLLRIPGIGPVGAKQLFEQHGVKTVKELVKLMDGDDVGFAWDEKLERNARYALARNDRRLPRLEMLELSYPIDLALRLACPRAIVEPAGSIRRKLPDCKDIDFVLAGSPEDLESGRQAFKALPWDDIPMDGPTRISAVRNGVAVDIRLVPRKCYGSAILYFTGSKTFNIAMRSIAKSKGFKLNEYGLYKIDGDNETLVAGEREEDIFGALKLRFVDPTERGLKADQIEEEAWLLEISRGLA